jgi:hypothetical protein
VTVREDLLHLSPEALAHAANAGIVKRAQRELAAGPPPQLALDDHGVLEARFDDGTLCRWPPAVAIADVQCSCGAAGICRHRVIAALAFRERAADAPGAPASLEATDVSEASDDVLASVVPASLLALAQAQRDAGVTVELSRRAGGEPCDTARLPSATVRFWAGAALGAARCDCIRASACEHVALGVWAFRAGAGVDARAPQLAVRLGAASSRHTIDRGAFDQLAAAVLRHGVTQGPAPLAQTLSAARAASVPAAWLAGVVADLEAWIEAWTRRSARYEAADGADLLAELALRCGAANRPAVASTALGLGQAGETPLDRLRLVCLGARTQRDGEARRTILVMADTDTGTRLSLVHDWSVPEAQARTEATLRAAERLAPGVRLEALAHGQLLAQQSVRLADGRVRIAKARTSLNSVLPQSGDWATLAAPIRFDSVAALRAERRARPVAALQDRHAARRYVVFSPAAVEHLAYDANDQCVQAVLRDAEGAPLLVRRHHEKHVPQALDAIAAALSGDRGRVRHIAGVLEWAHGLPIVEPWAIAADELAVPDVAAASGTLARLPLGGPLTASDDPCAAELAALRLLLAQLLHHGLARLPRDWAAESTRLAHRLEATGLRALASRLRALAPEVAAARARPDGSDPAPALMTLLALRQLHADAASLGDSAAGAADTPAPGSPRRSSR